MFKLRSNQICVATVLTMGLIFAGPVNAENTDPAPTNIFKGKNLQDLLNLKNATTPQAAPSAPSSSNTTPSGPPDLIPGLSVVVVIGKTDDPLADGVLQLGPQNSTSISADGCTFPWTYYVKNNGTGPTNQGFHSSLIVQKTVAGESKIMKVETNYWDSVLSGGHSTPIKGNLVLASGLYQLDVLVDRGNKVTEVDETNNRRGRAVQIANGCGNSS
jgi:hypothetical protein